jgi:hypothetical protein
MADRPGEGRALATTVFLAVWLAALGWLFWSYVR